MRLINADALIPMMKKATTDKAVGIFPILIGFNEIKQTIDEAPTIDYVQVVRCKDCKHNWVTSYNHGVQDEPRCKFTSCKFGLDDYCSRGERRE